MSPPHKLQGAPESIESREVKAHRLAELKRRAQAVLADASPAQAGAQEQIESVRLTQLLEDLRIYQVELELQNEELQAAQLEAEMARRRYQLLFAQMPLAAMVLDMQGQVDDRNERADALLGPRGHYVAADNRLWKLLRRADRHRLHSALRNLVPGEAQRVERLVLAPEPAQEPVFDAYLIGLSIDYKLDRRVLALWVDQSSEVARQRDQQLYTALLDSSDSFIYAADAQGSMVLANQALLSFLGVPREQVLGQKREQFLPLRTAIEQNQGDQKVLRDGQMLTKEDRIGGSAAQGELTFLTRKFPLRGLAGEIYGVGGISTDITQMKDQQRLAQMSEAVFMSSSDAIIITDADTHMLRVNPAFTRQTGFSAESVLGQKTNILKSGRQEKAFYTAMWQSLGSMGTWSGELCNRRSDGVHYTVWSAINAVVDAKGRVLHYVAVQTDVTQLHNAQQALAHQASYDTLTGLPNRALFGDRLVQLVASSQRHGKNFALLFVDLDRFKEVNDTLGHQVGDRLLKELAQRLQDGVRAEDTVARIGGDEFVVLLPDTDEAGALAAADNLLARVRAELVLDQTLPYRPMASMGMALFPRDGDTPDLLMRNADLAMYGAKLDGRNRVCTYAPTMRQVNDQLFAVQNDLILALEQGQLRLHYQPKCCLSDGLLVGAEALVRWQRAGSGLVLPGEFIGVAEKTGLLVALDKWVLNEALRQLGQWCAQGRWQSGWRLAVNQNVVDLQRPGMLTDLQQMLALHHVNATVLELEITEDALLHHTPEQLQRLEQLIQMGITVAIDDFGTGYSSLAYLHQLPASVIKIDRSFVSGMLTDDNDAVLVQTIINMAHNLGHKVVAEGIELPSQREMLQRLGAEVGQGFLFDPAIDAEQFDARWLAPVAAS
ncbi:MAG: hypothetical protein AUJ20_07445 [Comamonadaceae bacterium CG1_02_60_18]|nr:MAG: hypothetical protein AUJ20_07445 [Comamonadaceae bacterium CG1_02_60_18]